MEQIFDIFGIDVRLLLVQVFNFTVLLLALWYLLYRPLSKMVAKRQEVIETGVKEAEAAEADRIAAAHERREIVRKAAGEADEIVSNARSRAEVEEAAMLKAAQERSERLVKEAEMRAREQHRSILTESKEEIAKMAVLGAEKILRENGNHN